MAVGLTQPGPLAAVDGVRLATVSAGIARGARDDVLLMALDEGTQAAAVLTRNAFCAAPVQLVREHLVRAAPRWVLVNAGNANAGTGERGMADARACCEQLGRLAGVSAESVLPFSTGVIGQPLPMDGLSSAIDQGFERLGSTPGQADWNQAARAIMTTDTLPKGASVDVDLGAASVRITGIVKGAGMIRPDMATLLVFVATDARIEPTALQQFLDSAVGPSFNSISVDGDTSTNDGCLLLATGASGVDCSSGEAGRLFAAALGDLMIGLAQSVVRDAEGATKFVQLDVVEGVDEVECRQVAFTIAHSPLVKTALFASDANWGRILAAVGRSGLESLDTSSVSIWLGDVLIVEHGGLAASYTEAAGAEVMAREEIVIRVALGRGSASARVWTSDLSHEYVRINAEYRT